MTDGSHVGEVKLCKKCGIAKPVVEFHIDNHVKSGVGARCKKCHNAGQEEWRKNNLDKANVYFLKWFHDIGKEKAHAIARKSADKYFSTPKGKLDNRMTSGIRKALIAGKEGRSWEELVGYSSSGLIRHIEKNFLPRMSWENSREWHIDHIIPKSAFNYQTHNDIDFKQCWALQNLRPLWKSDNIRKSNKLDKPFQPSLAIGA